MTSSSRSFPCCRCRPSAARRRPTGRLPSPRACCCAAAPPGPRWRESTRQTCKGRTTRSLAPTHTRPMPTSAARSVTSHAGCSADRAWGFYLTRLMSAAISQQVQALVRNDSDTAIAKTSENHERPPDTQGPPPTPISPYKSVLPAGAFSSVPALRS